MKYNFDEIIDRRNTNALNTDGFRGYIFHAGPEMKFPYADDEFVRMWVADMEFATPPEICEAIKKRVEKRIFGYSCIFRMVQKNVRLGLPEGRTDLFSRDYSCAVSASGIFADKE